MSAPTTAPTLQRQSRSVAPAGQVDGDGAGRMSSSLVEGASGLRFETWGIAGGFAALAGLALMCLPSEASSRGSRKGNHMRANKGRHGNTKKSDTSTRKYWQYLLETFWAVGARVMASPLATLS